MELESTFETAKRLDLGELELGKIVEIIFKDQNANPARFGKLLAIEFLDPRVTWIKYAVRQNDAGGGCLMGTNLFYVEKIRQVSDEEILNRLNRIGYR